jgi:MFS family permease
MSPTAAGAQINSAPVPLRPAKPGRVAAARYGAGFWLIAFVFVTGMAFSTVPTPLYPLYQARDGFSTLTVTVVFAVYVVGVLTSLLLAGQVSDLVGRKKVLITALTLELIAAALFLAEPPLAVLLSARLVTGLGVGMLAPTASAYLHDLHEARRRGDSAQQFESVSTAANIGGLGVGPLVAGVLAQYLASPLRLPYLVFAGLLMLAFGAVEFTPETVKKKPVEPPYKPLRVSAGGGNRAGYLISAAMGFASFAVLGYSRPWPRRLSAEPCTIHPTRWLGSSCSPCSAPPQRPSRSRAGSPPGSGPASVCSPRRSE